MSTSYEILTAIALWCQAAGGPNSYVTERVQQDCQVRLLECHKDLKQLDLECFKKQSERGYKK